LFFINLWLPNSGFFGFRVLLRPSFRSVNWGMGKKKSLLSLKLGVAKFFLEASFREESKRGNYAENNGGYNG